MKSRIDHSPQKKCEGCPFGGPKVGSKGDPTSPLVIVAESPGAWEVRAREPLVGPSGRVFHNYVPEDAGYILNALECYPLPALKKRLGEKTMNIAGGCCQDRLLEKVAAHPRRVIIAMGNSAVRALTGNWGLKITQIRGRLIESPLATLGILPVVHIAALMKGGGSFRQWKQDVLYGLELGAGGSPREYTPADVQVIPKNIRRAEISDLFALMTYGNNKLTGDIETTGFDHISDRILSLGITPENDTGISYCFYPHHFPLLRHYLESSKIAWAWHNGKFDIKFLRKKGIRARVDDDTMLLSYCLAPSTRILTSDMRWKVANTIQIGDELVGFPEKGGNTDSTQMSPQSIMQHTMVTATRKLKAPRYRIHTSKGDIICSGKHMWATRRYGQPRRRWWSTETLYESKGKASLSLFLPPWNSIPDYERGYIEGILDGEGHLSTTFKGKSNSNWELSFSQKPGAVLDKCLDILNYYNIEYGMHKYEQKSAAQIRFAGHNGALRAMGLFRPVRMMHNLEDMWKGNRLCKKVDILDITYLGIGDVIGIETDSHTLIAEGFMSHNCLDEEGGVHDLETVSADVLGAPDYKYMIKPWLPNKQSSYELVPAPILAEYQAFDTANTARLRPILLNRVQMDPALKSLYEDTLIPASAMLTQVEENGICTDPKRINENETFFAEMKAEVGTEINELIGYNINPGSPKQVSRLLFEGYKFPNRSKGSTAEPVLLRLQKKFDHPIFNLILKHRKAVKMHGTYVKGLLKHVHADTNRVHATYLIHGTRTGRLSARNPNMQNPPRLPQIRGSFVAAPDHELVEVDLSQAELRGLGALSGDEGLLEIYNSGGDLHDEVAISLFPGWHAERGGAKEQRVKAKNVNFGIPYGITKYGLQGQIGGTTIEAARMLLAWDNRFPVARAFLNKCRKAPLNNQDLTTCFGRRKRVGLVSRENMQFLQNEAANFPIQSISSDITLHAAIRTWEQLLSWGVRIVNLVHDSIIMEVPLVGEIRPSSWPHDSQAKVPIRIAAIQLVANALRQVPIDYGITQVPFIADAEYGHRWGSLHKFKGDVYG